MCSLLSCNTWTGFVDDSFRMLQVATFFFKQCGTVTKARFLLIAVVFGNQPPNMRLNDDDDDDDDDDNDDHA